MFFISQIRQVYVTIAMIKNGRRGFTLIELLIVIAIIGILVAVAMPTFSDMLDKAKYATCQGNRRSLQGLVVAQHYLSGDSCEDVFTAFKADPSKDDMFVCPEHGEFVWEDSASSGLGYVKCKAHSGAVVYATTGDLAGAIGESFKSGETGYVYKNGIIASTETSAFKDEVLATLPPDMVAALEGKSWQINSTLSYYKSLLIYDGDITEIGGDSKKLSGVTLYDFVSGTTTLVNRYTGTKSKDGIKWVIITDIAF